MYPENIEKIFENKNKFHKRQANLPIEEKIRQLVKLQKIVLDIKKPEEKNNPKYHLWTI
jgi:hypothetical protein